jgi:hypothetical protein
MSSYSMPILCLPNESLKARSMPFFIFIFPAWGIGNLCIYDYRINSLVLTGNITVLQNYARTNEKQVCYIIYKILTCIHHTLGETTDIYVYMSMVNKHASVYIPIRIPDDDLPWFGYGLSLSTKGSFVGSLVPKVVA